jgi:hypothetical protein
LVAEIPGLVNGLVGSNFFAFFNGFLAMIFLLKSLVPRPWPGFCDLYAKR